jgi:hypothetical protein
LSRSSGKPTIWKLHVEEEIDREYGNVAPSSVSGYYFGNPRKCIGLGKIKEDQVIDMRRSVSTEVYEWLNPNIAD